jgi:hypothetical protein
MALGSENLTRVYSDAYELALLHTAPGQADMAVPNCGLTCAQCASWLKEPRGKKGRCLEYSRRMQGRKGPALNPTQTACKAFELREKR